MKKNLKKVTVVMLFGTILMTSGCGSKGTVQTNDKNDETIIVKETTTIKETVEDNSTKIIENEEMFTDEETTNDYINDTPETKALISENQIANKDRLTEDEIMEYPRFMSEDTNFKYEDIIEKDWVFNDSVCIYEIRFEKDGNFTYKGNGDDVIGLFNGYNRFVYLEEDNKFVLISDERNNGNGVIEVLAYWEDRIFVDTHMGLKEFYLKGSEPNVPVVDKSYYFGCHSFITVFDKCGDAMLTTHKKYDKGDDIEEYLISEECDSVTYYELCAYMNGKGDKIEKYEYREIKEKDFESILDNGPCSAFVTYASISYSLSDVTVYREVSLEERKEEERKKESNKKYYPDFLTKNAWQRGIDGCTEVIYFQEDGDFGYYCVCGSPVGFSDYYEEYKYDEEKRVIKVFGEDESDYITIKVIESSDNSLTLEFPENLEKGKKTFLVMEDDY